MLLTHIAVQAMSLAIAFLAFAYLTQYGWGQVFICVFFSCFYAVYMYSKAYKIGEKDSKSYSEHKPYPLKGLALYVLIFIVTLILLAVYFLGLSFQETNRAVYLICLNLFRFWNFNIATVLDAGDSFATLFYVLMFAIPVFSLLFGYIAGMKRFELRARITKAVVYKKQK